MRTPALPRYEIEVCGIVHPFTGLGARSAAIRFFLHAVKPITADPQTSAMLREYRPDESGYRILAQKFTGSEGVHLEPLIFDGPTLTVN
jgi:hypothetical protein